MPVLPRFPLTSQQNVGKSSTVLPKLKGLEFDTTETRSGVEGWMETERQAVRG